MPPSLLGPGFQVWVNKVVFRMLVKISNLMSYDCVFCSQANDHEWQQAVRDVQERIAALEARTMGADRVFGSKDSPMGTEGAWWKKE